MEGSRGGWWKEEWVCVVRVVTLKHTVDTNAGGDTGVIYHTGNKYVHFMHSSRDVCNYLCLGEHSPTHGAILAHYNWRWENINRSIDW